VINSGFIYKTARFKNVYMEYDILPKTNFSEEEVRCLEAMNDDYWDCLEVEEHDGTDGSFIVKFINVTSTVGVEKAIYRLRVLEWDSARVEAELGVTV